MDDENLDSSAGEMPHEDSMAARAPEVDPARANLVARWCRNIRQAKKRFAPDYERMRENMDLVLYGSSKQLYEQGHYVVPIIQRHINQSVAALYAKNPRSTAKRRKRLEYQLWDGDIQSLMMAQQAALAGDVNAAALLREVEEVKTRQQMFDRMAKTLEILFQYFVDEQETNFKTRLKQLVRRAKTCGVGYLELGYQRVIEQRPDVLAKIDDTKAKLERAKALLAMASDGDMDQDAPEVEELRLLLADLERQADVIVREGPVFDFPGATEIIPDPKCRQLNGFIGADWIAREFIMSPEKVLQTYNVSVKGRYKAYTGDSRYCEDGDDPDKDRTDMCCVWRVQDKKNRQVFTIIDGYPDFVEEPAEPLVQVEGFWTTFTLTFNEIEHEKRLFPPSDVEILKHPQLEYNRARQGLREHRIANRPAYATMKGMLDDQDKEALQVRPANAVVELKALQSGMTVDQVLQAIKPVPVDPALYETNSVFEDVLRSVGAQEANLGGMSGATATESSIAESSRTTSLASNVDDLDMFLTQVAKATGQLLLMEVDPATARKIAGPGAVWPEVSRQEAVEEIYLEVKAGSTGRPNRAAELANMERGMPVLFQVPGVNPYPVARKYLELLDIDLEEAIVEGLPSIVALNAMAGKQVQPSTGDPGTDPSQQGRAGSDNAPRAAENEPGPQPAYPQRGGIAPMA